MHTNGDDDNDDDLSVVSCKSGPFVDIVHRSEKSTVIEYVHILKLNYI